MWQVYGQDHILRELEPSLRQGRAAHAYLLVGPPQVGKMTLALDLARSVNCLQGPGVPCGSCSQCARIGLGQHAGVRTVAVPRGDPDEPTHTVIGANAVKTVAVHRGDPDEPTRPDSIEGPRRSRATVIGIDAIKGVLHQVHLKPYEGNCTVIIFDRAEQMSDDAANALLKTLEEPPPQVMLLLLTADEEALLTTIRSRCRRLLLRPVSKGLMVERLVASHGVDPDRAEWLARFARGCPGWAVAALAEGEGLLESRGAHLARLMEMCESGLEARFSFANDLAFLFSRDREAVRQVFYLWLRWWRDLLLIKEGAEVYVHNEDRITELRLQASRLATAQVVGFIKRLVETLEALDRNASPRLALEVMMLDLPTTAVQI